MTHRGMGFLVGLAGLLGGLYLLAQGRELLIPLAAALLIWFLLNALARLLERIPGGGHLPGWLRLALSLALVALLMTAMVAALGQSLSGVADAAPRYQETLLRVADQALEVFAGEAAPGAAARYLKSLDLAWLISGAAGAATLVAGNTGLILIYVLFLLFEQKSFEAKLRALVPDPQRQAELRHVIARIQKRILDYVWIKTLLGLLAAGASFAILAAFGVDYPVFWAFFVFLLYFIPTVGSLAGVFFPGLMALLQFPAVGAVLGVAGGLAVVQFIVANLLEPKLLGGKLNLSTVVILFSLALWGKLWGVVGMFLCVPITVVALIIFAHFPGTRPIAVLLSESGNLETLTGDGED